MKSIYLKTIYLCLFNVLAFTGLIAQNSENVWSKIQLPERQSINNTSKTSDVYELNTKVFSNYLNKKILKRGTTAVSNVRISFPNATGNFETFLIKEASIMHPDLQEKFPDIRSFIGESTSVKGNSIRFSFSKLGMHAMIFRGDKGIDLINPVSQSNRYVVLSKKQATSNGDFQCLVDEQLIDYSKKQAIAYSSNFVNDGVLRTFRLALACTQEYANFHLTNQSVPTSATDAVKKEAVLAAMNKTMTRVNGIFERDISLTMQLVANETALIFLKEDDGFSNNDENSLIDESQAIIDAVIGVSNYDIGHTFSTGAGGLAMQSSPCTVNKAMGVTGSSSPIDDAFDIDYVAHEMGHQFGASHTFNGKGSNCNNGNRTNATAVEPGSGTTIMSYAGICSPVNIQLNVDAYFHAVSIEQMYNNITSGNSLCANVANINNIAPVVEAGQYYTIPVGTPFALKAIASDANSDALTYVWDQLDTGLVSEFPTPSTTVDGPLFRSFAPSENAVRYFPKLETVIAGNTSSTWEVLPTVTRNMSFGVLVRDNNAYGGQTGFDTTIISVSDKSGPFRMTSQSVSETWQEGAMKTITWDVANTRDGPVNCAQVTILLSIDGGFTFPITLAQNVPNNGSYDIVVPKQTSLKGRVKVVAANSIFYTMNTADISIQASEFVMEFITNSKDVCAGESVDFNFTYKTFASFNEVTTFSTINLPAGVSVVFNPTTATASNTAVVMTVSGASESILGSQTIDIVGTASSTTKDAGVTMNVYATTISPPVLSGPSNNSLGLVDPIELSWGADSNAIAFEYQISDTATFTSIEKTAVVSAASVAVPDLAYNTTFYWRVRTLNSCGQSAFSTVYQFKTANVKCGVSEYMGADINIPDNDANGINSVIEVTDQFAITDVNVTVTIEHDWVSDLSIVLVGPNNVPIELVTNKGGGGDNFTQTVFDDEQSLSIAQGTAPFTGSFRPLKPLAVFDGLSSSGTWTLKVNDGSGGNTGILKGWELNICGILLSDADGDGVEDAEDDCPNTPTGVGVNARGCPFDLAVNNFTILAKSETCAGKQNGVITISTASTHNYSVTIDGSTYNFTDSLEVINLSPNIYNFCIQIPEEGNYEQCFSVTIDAGGSLSGKAAFSKKTNQANIEVFSGTPPFSIYINDAFVSESFDSEISIAVQHGDIVTVRSSVLCEGSFSQQFEIFNKVTVFPNPTKNVATIVLFEHLLTKVSATIYNAQMQLVAIQECIVVNGVIQVDLTSFPSGVYVVAVAATKPVTVKLLKK